jgi:hypothetical protein
MSEAVAALIVPADTKISMGGFDNIEHIKPLLNESLTGYIVEFNGTEPTAPEAVVETTGFGKNIITSESTPILLAYAETNACDFGEMLQHYKGGSYGVYFFGADGYVLGTKKGGDFAPFTSQVWAHGFGIPGRENQTQQFRITFNFLRNSEFDNFIVEEINYSIDDLFMSMPVGLTMKELSGFIDTGLDVELTYRCQPDNFKSGAVDAEIVKKTPGVDMVVTFTEEGTVPGKYTVSVTLDGTTPLQPGHYAIFRAYVQNGTIYEEVSNNIKVTHP